MLIKEYNKMQQNLTEKFIQILIQTAMRYYARKVVFTFDQQLRKAVNYNKLTVICDSCNTKNSFLDYSIFIEKTTHDCLNCR